MFTSLIVTLVLAVPLVLAILLVPALLVQRFFADPAEEEEDWVDRSPQGLPIRFDVDAAPRARA